MSDFVFMILLFLIFVSAVICFYVFLNNYQFYKNRKHVVYEKIQCRVVEVKITETSKGTICFPVVEFKYNKLSLRKTIADYKGLKIPQVGDELDIYFSPQNYGEFVRMNIKYNKNYFLIFLVGIALIVMGVLFFIVYAKY